MQRLRDIWAYLRGAMGWRVLRNPRFLIPVLAIVVFSISAFGSTLRILDQTGGVFSSTLEKSFAVGVLEDHFHDFEEQVLLYAGGGRKTSTANLLKTLNRFQNEMDAFKTTGHLAFFSPEVRPAFDSLKDVFVSIENDIRNSGFLETRKISASLVGHLSDAHEAIEALDADSALNKGEASAYREREWQKNKIFWSVLLMGISGLILIVVLVDRLASLERVENERRRAVAEEARRAVAMDEAFEGMILSNENGVVVYVNRAALRLYGYGKSDQVVGRFWKVFFSNDQARRFQTDTLPRVEREERWSGNAYGCDREGKIFPLDVSVARLPEGGHIWVMRDISRQIESERISQRRLAAIEAAGDGIAIVGPDGALSYMNHAMMDIYGIPEDEESRYFGKGWDSLYDGKDLERLNEEIMPVVLRTGYWNGEMEMGRRDERRVWVEMSLTRLPDGGIVKTVRDISDRKRAEKEREALQAQFHQAQKMEAVGRLAGGIAHDFNNILAAIMGYAEFLDEDLSADPEKKKFAEGILTAGGQARGLIDQLLSFSRRKETNRETIDITKVVQETISLLRASLPRTISVETDISVPNALVYANATQIAQAVMNLCVNARDAMEDGHGQLSVGLEIVDADPDLYEDMLCDDFLTSDAPPPIRLHDVEPAHCCLELGILVRGRRYVRLSVSDTGSGMSKAIMEHIFEPFFTTKDVDKGTGLGLANVHGVMMAHQGALVIDSVIGEGTRFDLFFPLSESQEDMASAIPGYEGVDSLPTQGRILVVDDQDQVRDMITVLLRRQGYEVSVCENAMDALARLRQFPEQYDLVVTDHNMPKMTGLELADQIHYEIPWMPFILVTGYSAESLNSAPDEHPSVKAILRKPIERQAFTEAVRGVLSSSRAAA